MLTKKQASDKQEKAIAKYLGWKQVKGSGARPTFTGDVESSTWLGECKTHVTPNHKIHFEVKVWKKICEEATAKFRSPVYFSDDGSQKLEKTFVMFSSTATFPNEYSVECEIQTAWNFDYYQLPTGYIYTVKFGDEVVRVARLEDFKEVMWLC